MKYISFTDMNPVLWYVSSITTEQAEKISGKISYANRLLWIQHGICTLLTNTARYVLRERELLYLPADTQYATEMNESVQLTNIFFDFLPVQRNQDKNHFVYIEDYNPMQMENVAFTDVALFSDTFQIPVTTAIEKQIELLIHEETLRRKVYRLRQKAILTDLLVQICRNGTDGEPDSRNSAVEELLYYIVENCESPLSRSSLSSIFHYHPNTINRMVQSATGMTLHQYIEDTRIKRAMQLLSATDLSITDIAHRLQYYDNSHFSSVFQKHTGCKPSEYRNRRIICGP